MVLLILIFNILAWFFKPSASVTCSTCHYAVGFIDGLLVNNKTEKLIEDAVEKLCGYLPAGFKNEVSSYFFNSSNVISFEVHLKFI